MGIKILYTILFSVAAFAATAADISFVVYSVTGSVHKNSKATIKKGDKILANETIVLSDRSGIILICSNYKVIQLNKKGTYTSKSLLTKCSGDAAGYSTAYFKYVWDEFTHPHGKPESNPGDYMKNVGAVSRGCNMVQTGIAVDTLHYLSGNLPVYWNSSFTRPVLAVYDVPVDGGPLQKTVLVKDEPVQINKLAATLQPGDYYWSIIDADGNGCERKFLKVWPKEAYQQKVKELKASIPVSTPAETAFATGFVLQQHHFVAAAIDYYSLAVKLHPANKLYKKTLSQFYATQF